jgi:hypothetical protein
MLNWCSKRWTTVVLFAVGMTLTLLVQLLSRSL